MNKIIVLLFLFSVNSFAGEILEVSSKYTTNMVSKSDLDGIAANKEISRKEIDDLVKELEEKCPGIDLLEIKKTVEGSEFQMSKVFMRADVSGYCKS